MGLDNGVIIKAKTIRAEELLKENFSYLDRDYSPLEYEFDYWRKQWNMRDRVLTVFSDKYNNNDCVILMNYLDLYNYVDKVLKYFLDEDNYNNCEHSYYWDWHDFIVSIAQGIKNITDFLILVKEKEILESEFEIYWYDSY